LAYGLTGCVAIKLLACTLVTAREKVSDSSLAELNMSAFLLNIGVPSSAALWQNHSKSSDTARQHFYR